MSEITVKSWNRFISTNLCVKADIMGCIHEFNFEDHNVTVRLPKQEHAGRDNRHDNVASLISSRADTNEPLLYRVLKVDVEIVIPKKINVPQEALSNPPNQYDHFSKQQERDADNLCMEYSSLAKRAFQYWLEIMRWASGYALIGQPEFSNFDSGWSTYLIDSSTNHEVWAESLMFTVYKDSEITKEDWENALMHLQNGDVIPMHHRFLHDAKASIRYRQYEKAIIELAMACEIFLRYSAFEFIPKTTPEPMKTYIEEANINQYVSKFFKNYVPSNEYSNYKRLAKDISSLMSRRNSYVHMGVLNDANADLCQRFASMTEKLFKIKLAIVLDEN